MLVFNLTQKELDYRGRKIPPNGGSLNYPELDKMQVPRRDLALEQNRVLGFGKLPYWWHLEQGLKVARPTEVPLPKEAPPVVMKAVEAKPMSDEDLEALTAPPSRKRK